MSLGSLGSLGILGKPSLEPCHFASRANGPITRPKIVPIQGNLTSTLLLIPFEIIDQISSHYKRVIAFNFLSLVSSGEENNKNHNTSLRRFVPLVKFSRNALMRRLLVCITQLSRDSKMRVWNAPAYLEGTFFKSSQVARLEKQIFDRE